MKLTKIADSYPIQKILLLFLMLVLLGVGAVPGYIKGRWTWVSPPDIAHLKPLKELQNTGLKVSGWKTEGQQVVSIGGQKWLRLYLEETDKDPKTGAIALLMNQRGAMNQPQVEWMDMDGYWRWKTDSHQLLEFEVDRADLKETAIEPIDTEGMPEVTQVKARFFRGWTNQQTYAIAQWYAWPDGGSSLPSDWFWHDRLAQLQNKRVPWVAVSVIIPIEPLGNIEKARPRAESLSKEIQAALMREPFTQMKIYSH